MMAALRDGISLFLSEDHKRLLRETTITPEQPGPILHDFQMLLDFIGSAGAAAGGQHHLLPIVILPTLNSHMSWPIMIDLKRPQLRSYTNLQGLHLLSRATGLVVVQGAGSKARLVVDPLLSAKWTSLNSAEQYFSLLDAWLTHARKEMLGANRGRDESFIDYMAQVWAYIPAKGQHYSPKERSSGTATLFPDPDRYTIALMQLFGLVKIEQGDPIRGCPWLPVSIRRRPFGEALLAALGPRIPLIESMRRWAKDLEDPSQGKALSDNAIDDDNNSNPQSGDDDGRFHFDSFHPIFAPYFPSLRNSLAIDNEEASDGLHIFCVSLPGMWRRISAPAETTLDDLADAILKSVGFEQDHLWNFSFTSRFGARVEVGCDMTEEEDGVIANEVEVCEVPLHPGDSMIFQFDYGDDWEFTVLLERIDPPVPKQKKPRLIKKHGPSPTQYRHWSE
jgi:hypothetical protein